MKEVEVLGQSMGKAAGLPTLQKGFCLVLTILIVTHITSQSTIAQVKNYDDGWQNDIQVSGGRTILVEEISATWCVSCADIDPYLQQVADAHGSRISIVTYHPADGEDAFQPEAAKQRIDRMRLVHENIGATPTFVVESGQLRIGPDSWPDVQKDILMEETNRQSASQLSYTISQNGTTYNAKINPLSLVDTEYNTQLTFMLMVHEKAVPDGYINPGEAYRDRVVVATASCELQSNSLTNIGFTNTSANNCDDDFSVYFTTDGKFSLILIHEATNEVVESDTGRASTLGVVEFAYRDIELTSEVNILPYIFFTMISIGVIWVIYDKKYS
tara:strand:- start:586 stop:1572 length:987 start_codon:yes stop_codon:yes gene_type:complete